MPAPGMGTALDALTTAPQPLTARRPAASNLPTFELPPPDFQLANPGSQKFPSPPSVNPVSNVSVGNLLSPLSSQSGEGTTTSLPPSIPSTTVSAAQDLPSSYPSGFWQSQNSYNYGTSHQSWQQGSTGLFPPPRGGLSPSSGPLARSSSANPPPVTESMSQSYDLNQLPPFQQPSIPVSSPATATPVVQQQPQQQQQAMAHTMIGAHGGVSTTSAPSPHQLGAGAPYGTKPHSAPLFGASPTAAPQQQGSYPPPYGGPSPVAPSGLGIHGAPRMPPGSSQSPSVPLGYPRPPWPSYSLPAMNGPVMTNVHNPNGQMSLMGNVQQGFMPGFTSGHLASMQHLYGGHPPHHPAHGQPAPPNDRPFKCDQCPQSFNRNHDLKRHKRIHLSVKPFPCNHCEKSFSRKDALKVSVS